MELRAGRLSMGYEDGFLRCISAGNAEVLRMIYFAVRDKDWDTIPSVISQEQVIRHADSFLITYRRDFHRDDIQMSWEVKIQGMANGEIRFEIRGEALSDFYKNRTGFCILHPIRESVGKELVITHPGGGMEKGIFPIHISPHQPFKDIASMQWHTTAGAFGKLHFTGDLFEMEDQRNWTDNSFKTYCTPLERPFPALMRQGDKVHQSIHFSLSPYPMPAIGIGRSAVRDKHYPEALERLSGTGFSHYRTDLRLSGADWSDTLAASLEESRILKAPLEIALFMRQERELDKFLDAGFGRREVKSIILLEQEKPCIHNRLVQAALPLLRGKFPGIAIGAGTDSHFTELNRSDLSPDGLDFISYAIHPQVHASDDVTLMENAEAQGFTVETARYKYGLPVHVSPVTLHDRRITDPRLHTGLGAQWTSASLQSLRSAGAASITYFEALGERGVASFGKEFDPYPLLEVFGR